MKIDRFTWVVLGVVTLTLVAAVVTVNLTEGRGASGDSYLTENTPAAPVYNAFVAFQNGDVQMAREQYSTRVLEEMQSERGYNPFSDRFSQRTARRLRIVETSIDDNNPSRAYVTVVIDTYSGAEFFGTGSTWSRRLVIDMVREDGNGDDGVWKLDTAEFFY